MYNAYLLPNGVNTMLVADERKSEIKSEFMINITFYMPLFVLDDNSRSTRNIINQSNISFTLKTLSAYIFDLLLKLIHFYNVESSNLAIV